MTWMRCGVVILVLAAACGGPPSEDEHMSRLAQCLRSVGYEVELASDGSVSADYGRPDELPAFQQAKAECDRAIGKPAPQQPLSDTEIRERYAYLLEMRRCLVGAGYKIIVPPPVETFIETWDTGPWSPYNEVPSSALGDAERRCPQVPDGP